MSLWSHSADTCPIHSTTYFSQCLPGLTLQTLAPSIPPHTYPNVSLVSLCRHLLHPVHHILLPMSPWSHSADTCPIHSTTYLSQCLPGLTLQTLAPSSPPHTSPNVSLVSLCRHLSHPLHHILLPMSLWSHSADTCPIHSTTYLSQCLPGLSLQTLAPSSPPHTSPNVSLVSLCRHLLHPVHHILIPMSPWSHSADTCPIHSTTYLSQCLPGLTLQTLAPSIPPHTYPNVSLVSLCRHSPHPFHHILLLMSPWSHSADTCPIHSTTFFSQCLSGLTLQTLAPSTPPHTYPNVSLVSLCRHLPHPVHHILLPMSPWSHSADTCPIHSTKYLSQCIPGLTLQTLAPSSPPHTSPNVSLVSLCRHLSHPLHHILLPMSLWSHSADTCPIHSTTYLSQCLPGLTLQTLAPSSPPHTSPNVSLVSLLLPMSPWSHCRHLLHPVHHILIPMSPWSHSADTCPIHSTTYLSQCLPGLTLQTLAPSSPPHTSPNVSLVALCRHLLHPVHHILIPMSPWSHSADTCPIRSTTYLSQCLPGLTLQTLAPSSPPHTSPNVSLVSLCRHSPHPFHHILLLMSPWSHSADTCPIHSTTYFSQCLSGLTLQTLAPSTPPHTYPNVSLVSLCRHLPHPVHHILLPMSPWSHSADTCPIHSTKYLSQCIPGLTLQTLAPSSPPHTSPNVSLVSLCRHFPHPLHQILIPMSPWSHSADTCPIHSTTYFPQCLPGLTLQTLAPSSPTRTSPNVSLVSLCRHLPHPFHHILLPMSLWSHSADTCPIQSTTYFSQCHPGLTLQTCLIHSTTYFSQCLSGLTLQTLAPSSPPRTSPNVSLVSLCRHLLHPFHHILLPMSPWSHSADTCPIHSTTYFSQSLSGLSLFYAFSFL